MLSLASNGQKFIHYFLKNVDFRPFLWLINVGQKIFKGIFGKTVNFCPFSWLISVGAKFFSGKTVINRSFQA